ncbi:hypothetical protein CYLTODRAFT_363327 [Cylindrobasidium torrendii FP15055 ss-10]|uniref:Tc1-like transposase DDE domain-containing protein n=1 Tax=Cylindrobasidium torrendii FP15055 ss-10 TaxID=1314674 RepID=A0A0D7ARV1_9AGAR|nr:hypothetical protein CYLTODRAFT_363327 [Cylindrobasidium torrendii FP15055 ss-10]
MEAFGIRVLFLPKFHCELNPIEQCWGYAKRLYRLNPESSREDTLKVNAERALSEIPHICIKRFFNRMWRFVSAYQQGMSGPMAAWAQKKYRGHRVIPSFAVDNADRAAGK